MLRSQDIQKVEVGPAVDGSSGNVLLSNDAVDLLALDVIELLRGFDFAADHVSKSYGIQPWTGHTQNVYFKFGGDDRLRCIVEVSKSAFSAAFEEIEVAPNSNEFSTSDADRAVVSDAAVELKALVSQRIPNRSIKISVFSSPSSQSDSGP